MTNEEILRAAIEKAVMNGWEPINIELMRKYESVDLPEVLSKTVDYRRFIFDHDFAKAFWGEELVCAEDSPLHMAEDSECKYCEYPRVVEAWQYHLQQMVLEEDPIKYLEQFIGGKNE